MRRAEAKISVNAVALDGADRDYGRGEAQESTLVEFGAIARFDCIACGVLDAVHAEKQFGEAELSMCRHTSIPIYFRRAGDMRSNLLPIELALGAYD